MTASRPIRMFVENRAEELIVAGIFVDLVHDSRVDVKMCWEASSALSLAEASLLKTPSLPVALVLNCPADPVEFRLPIESVLSRTAGHENWHITLAIPDVTAWLLADPQYAAAVAGNVTPDSNSQKMDTAVHFKDWVEAGNRLNQDEVSSKNEEFERLVHFVNHHLQAATTSS